MFVLADSMVVATWVAIVLSALGVGLAGFSIWLTPKQAEMQSIRADAKASATAVVDARFAAVEAAQNAINARLERGDGSFDRLDDRALEIERMLNTRLDELQRWMHKEFAGKGDVNQISARLDQIATLA